MMGKLQDIGSERARSGAVEHERDARQLHVCRQHDFPDRAVRELMLQEKHTRCFVRIGVDQAILVLWGRVNDTGANIPFKELTIPGHLIQIGVELCT